NRLTALDRGVRGGGLRADAMRGHGVVEALLRGIHLHLEATLGRDGRRFLEGEVREIRYLERLPRHEAREGHPGRRGKHTGQQHRVDHSSEHSSHGKSTLAGLRPPSLTRPARTGRLPSPWRIPALRPPAPRHPTPGHACRSRGRIFTCTRTRPCSSTSRPGTRATRTTIPTRLIGSRRAAAWIS